MKIETKFDIGQTCYVLCLDVYGWKIEEFKITKIIINESNMSYWNKDKIFRFEEELFATEQEAREYLKRNKL